MVNSIGVRAISGYRGVYANSSGYYSKINDRGRLVYLGQFADPVQAALAYDEAARVVHCGIAQSLTRLN